MSDRNGTIQRILPPGFVDGYCATCKVDRVVPEATLACPICGTPLHPDSLPSRPRTAVLALRTEPVVPEAPKPVKAAVRPATPQPEPKATPSPVVETIQLPALTEALAWFDSTVSLGSALAEREAELVAELRAVRGLRKLVDAVTDRIAVPEIEAAAPPSRAVIAVETIDVGRRLPVGPAHPDARTTPQPTRWAPRLGLDACRICGACDQADKHQRHASKGRCIRCDSYWRSTGKRSERPIERHDNERS